jgi:hypothetical protein
VSDYHQDPRRPVWQVADLIKIAKSCQERSPAPDYWQGVEDGLRYAAGELPDAIQARMLTEGI